MNIIFLDIDGVLNSMAYFAQNKGKGRRHSDISDYHLKMLAEIYHTCNAKIVLSSSWREIDNPTNPGVYWLWEYLVDKLAEYGMEIMDKTPLLPDMNRPLEIKTWLDQQPNKKSIRFVSLDDDFSKERYDEYGIGDCLIKTSFYCDDVSEGGLQREHVDKAIELLRGKNND